MDRREPASHYTSLARRLTGWTSNLLVTAVIVVIAIVGGRELVSWWTGDSSASTLAELSPAARWQPPDDSYLLEFGDSPFRLQRDRVAGTRDAAINRLASRCRETLELRADPPIEVGDAEKRLLLSVKDVRPLEESPGAWRLYRSEGPMPMLIGIRDDFAAAGNDNPDASNDNPDGGDNNPGGPGDVCSRMVVWGIAVPEGSDVWNTYTCRMADRSDPGNHHNQNFNEYGVVIPEGARKTLGITGEDGSRIVGFVGGNRKQIVEHYDREANESGWKPSGVWRNSINACRAEFTRDTPSATRMEIQLNIDDQQRTSGLITVVPVGANETADVLSQEESN